MIVAKRVSFDAAHYLPNYEGKCKNLHGHHWVVEVACSGKVNKRTGMVIDFTKLKAFCEGIKDYLDHTLINDSEFIKNPTAENICTYIYEEFEYWCSNNSFYEDLTKLAWVKVWETEDSYVELRREDEER